MLVAIALAHWLTGRTPDNTLPDDEAANVDPNRDFTDT
jgi:hypothetical protein